MKKFVCDKMCSELGKWLRAAGYDTDIIQTPLEDEEIFNKAVEEERFLITRDKDFKTIDPDKQTVIYLRSEAIDDWARQLKVEEGVDWLFRPFSRCLQCNSPFEKTAPPSEFPEGIPEDAEEFWSCPSCDQLFWLGSHTERMESQLKAWQSGS
ncbi:MAG: hypothetical protein K940chlam3_01051 [Chlamydiae bacterium]|nr:hypothetical protein [Chlamydiota bacterium]